MKVKQLVEILQAMDQEAVVNVYNGYCPEFGETYKDEFEIAEEAFPEIKEKHLKKIWKELQ